MQRKHRRAETSKVVWSICLLRMVNLSVSEQGPTTRKNNDDPTGDIMRHHVKVEKREQEIEREVRPTINHISAHRLP